MSRDWTWSAEHGDWWSAEQENDDTWKYTWLKGHASTSRTNLSIHAHTSSALPPSTSIVPPFSADPAFASHTSSTQPLPNSPTSSTSSVTHSNAKVQWDGPAGLGTQVDEYAKTATFQQRQNAPTSKPALPETIFGNITTHPATSGYFSSTTSHRSGLHNQPIYQTRQHATTAQSAYISQQDIYQNQFTASDAQSREWSQSPPLLLAGRPPPFPPGEGDDRDGDKEDDLRTPQQPEQTLKWSQPQEYAISRGTRYDFNFLDSSYKIMTSKFFTRGRVLALLFSEGLGAGGSLESDNVTVVKYNEHVYSQIRRFVVVQEKRGFCYACPIYTYGGRGTIKAGVYPDDHAIICSLGQVPRLLNGEKLLTKNPIRVILAGRDIRFSPASRINFAINYPIQHNVKVKDLGMVADDDMDNLIEYWRDEKTTESEIYDGGSKRKKVQPSPGEVPPGTLGQDGEWVVRSSTEPIGVGGAALVEPMRWPLASGSQTLHTPHVISSRTLTSTNMAGENEDSAALEGVRYSKATKVPGRLDSRFTYITNTHGYFKRGKVFMVLWAEPRGASNISTPDEFTGELGDEQFFCEIRRFCIIRRKPAYCLCLPISTYSGQATTKPGLVVQDHAVIAPVGGSVQLHPKEQQLTKSPLFVIVEDQAVSIDAMSRINFAKVYTVEYNVKIRKIGRICADSMKDLEDYFLESIGLKSQA